MDSDSLPFSVSDGLMVSTSKRGVSRLWGSAETSCHDCCSLWIERISNHKTFSSEIYCFLCNLIAVAEPKTPPSPIPLGVGHKHAGLREENQVQIVEMACRPRRTN